LAVVDEPETWWLVTLSTPGRCDLVQEVYATHVASKVLSVTLLGVNPDVAISGELVLHAAADPGQEDSAVLWSRDVLP
ncbi:hypothetical protein KCV00_g419, partial [Aureobasidium melanogenum]